MASKLGKALAGFFGIKPKKKKTGNRSLPPEMQKEIMAAAEAKRKRRYHAC